VKELGTNPKEERKWSWDGRHATEPGLGLARPLVVNMLIQMEEPHSAIWYLKRLLSTSLALFFVILLSLSVHQPYNPLCHVPFFFLANIVPFAWSTLSSTLLPN
jgi:hypothetical protein